MFITIYITYLVICSIVDADKLILSQIVFRHGARASVEKATTEEAAEHFFRGRGQLTDEGIQQGYELGKALRQRTQNLIDLRLIPDEVEFRSSPSDRCIQTAEAVSMGLFNQTSTGLPVIAAVHTFAMNDSWLLYPVSCPIIIYTIGHELRMTGNYTYFQVLKRKVSQLCKQSTHWKNQANCKNMEAYMIESRSRLAVPDWFNEDVEYEAQTIASEALHYITGSGKFKNRDFIQRRVGLLLDTLLNTISKAAEAYQNGTNYKKLFAYATHDIMLLPLFTAFGLDTLDEHLPPFTTSLLIELWEINDELKIKFFFRRDRGSFIPITRDVEVCKYQEECNITTVLNCCDEYRHTEPWKLCENIENAGSTYLSGVLLIIISLLTWIS